MSDMIEPDDYLVERKVIPFPKAPVRLIPSMRPNIEPSSFAMIYRLPTGHYGVFVSELTVADVAMFRYLADIHIAAKPQGLVPPKGDTV